MHYFLRKSGRVAECVCLENRSPERDRGFESLLFRTLTKIVRDENPSGSHSSRAKNLQHLFRDVQKIPPLPYFNSSKEDS